MINPQPGKMARVEVKYRGNPGDFYPHPKSSVFIGMIEKPMAWVDSDHFQMHAGKDEHKGFKSRVIRKSNVLNFQYLDGSEVEEKEVQQIDQYEKTVEGSKGDFYIVKKNGDRWTCTCTGFGFRKHCKHITAAKKEYHNGSE